MLNLCILISVAYISKILPNCKHKICIMNCNVI